MVFGVLNSKYVITFFLQVNLWKGGKRVCSLNYHNESTTALGAGGIAMFFPKVHKIRWLISREKFKITRK